MKAVGHVVLLEPPGPETPGRYLLTLYRPGGGLMGPSAITFAVDGLRLIYTDYATPGERRLPAYYVGYRADGPDTTATVVQFPAGDDYLLFDRSLAKVLTPDEFNKRYEETAPEYDERPPYERDERGYL